MWAVSLVFFLTCSLTLYFLIEHFTGKARSILVVLRVALLDGLFLIMGITLGICIIIVSQDWGEWLWCHCTVSCVVSLTLWGSILSLWLNRLQYRDFTLNGMSTHLQDAEPILWLWAR